MKTTEQPLKSQRKNYHCLQALRAIAAGLVVMHHSISLWVGNIMHRPISSQWSNGAAGVDIFFVISGFVMAISLPGLAGRKNKAGVFLWRRFARIVPLYWMALTAKLALMRLKPATDGSQAELTPWRTTASYLFIQAKNWKGEMFPLLVPGWTLNFEVFFYLLFALALALNVSPLAFLTPCLTGLALLGTMRTGSSPDFTSLASPIILEFLFGVALAHFAFRWKAFPKGWGLVLLAGGFVALMLIPNATEHWRILGWGLPAAAIVTGAVSLEDAWGNRMPKWLLEAGDASYALYLVQSLVLPFIGTRLIHSGITGLPALAAAIILGLGVNLVLAVAVHRYFERPLMKLLNKKRHKAVPVDSSVLVPGAIT